MHTEALVNYAQSQLLGCEAAENLFNQLGWNNDVREEDWIDGLAAETNMVVL